MNSADIDEVCSWLGLQCKMVWSRGAKYITRGLALPAPLEAQIVEGKRTHAAIEKRINGVKDADKVPRKKPPVQASKREACSDGGVRAWEAGRLRPPRGARLGLLLLLVTAAGDHLEQVVDDAVDEDATDGDSRAW